MRIGGGRDKWMVVLPLLGLVVFVGVMLGGPEDALRTMETLFVDALDAARTVFRR